ncbi:MAG: hypothetical protein CYG61_08160, partial [Actinobacteria bacterium]
GGGNSGGGNSGGGNSGGGNSGGGNSAEQSANSDQEGESDVFSVPIIPVNANTPVCVLADCEHASATQDNSASGSSHNDSDQTQVVANGGGGSGGNSAEQSADSDQEGESDVFSVPIIPVNANTPVCVLADCEDPSAAQDNSASGSSHNDSSQTQVIQ